MLASLIKKPNIHSLQREPERGGIMAEIIKKYNDLKVCFFDESVGLWHAGTPNPNEVIHFHSYIQLIGVQVEMELNKVKGEKIYSALRESNLFDKTRKVWNSSVRENLESPDMCNYSNNYLSDLVIKNYLEPEKTAKRYESLKTTSLFDSQRKLWKMTGGTNDFSIQASLIALLIECKINLESGIANFQAFKNMPDFYDQGAGLWMNKEYLQKTYLAGDQLLSLLVEAEIEPKDAKYKLENLKKSNFYNKKSGHWVSCDSANESGPGSLIVKNELYEILLELRLIKKLGESMSGLALRPLPEMRRF